MSGSENAVTEGLYNLTNVSASPAPPSIDGAYEIMVSAVFSVIIVGGLIGNALVIFTVIRWKDMQTPCNYLVMNIAIADFAVALIAAPLRILEVYLGWPFGSFMCHFLVPLQDLFVCVSAVTHTAIALERYRAILKPMKPRISLQTTRVAIASSWILCYITGSLPVALLVGLTKHFGRTYCIIFWPSDLIRQVYEIFLVTFFIAIPLAIQSWAYICMRRTLSLKLFHHIHSCRGVSRRAPNGQRQKKSTNIKKRIRLIRILFLLVILFQICYIPRGVIMLVKEFGYFPQSSDFLYLNVGALILYYVKHVFNPIILFLTSSEFRSHWINNQMISCERTKKEPDAIARQRANRDHLNGVRARTEVKGKFFEVAADSTLKGSISPYKLESVV